LKILTNFFSCLARAFFPFSNLLNNSLFLLAICADNPRLFELVWGSEDLHCSIHEIWPVWPRKLRIVKSIRCAILTADLILNVTLSEFRYDSCGGVTNVGTVFKNQKQKQKQLVGLALYYEVEETWYTKSSGYRSSSFCGDNFWFSQLCDLV